MLEITIEFLKSYKDFPVNENIIKTGKIIKELEYKFSHRLNNDFDKLYLNYITKKDFKLLLDKLDENNVKYHNIMVVPK